MIISFILSLIASLLAFVIAVLPTGSFPVYFSTAFDYFVAVLSLFNWLFPIDTLFTVFVLYIVIQIALYQYGLAMIVLRLVAGRNRTPH